MKPNGVMTLLSDFGTRDPYVGILKGVILGIAPRVRIVDLTHDLPPQDIRGAAFSLLIAYPYFPPGTVHLAVVDPGVGGARRAVAVAFEDGFFVGPDNGLLTGLLGLKTASAAVELTARRLWLTEAPSATFHGRDLFAPVAARLADGMPLARFGKSVDPATLVRLDLPAFLETGHGSEGIVQHIDRFGNLLTNMPGALAGEPPWEVRIAGETIPGRRTYAEAAPGTLLALVGSHGFIEIAANGGDAAALLHADCGTAVSFLIKS